MDANALWGVLDIATIIFLVLVLVAVAITIFLSKDKRLAVLKKIGRKLSSF